MYNVMIVEDDPMARRLLEIMVTSDESYHLAVSVESASVAEVYCMTEAIDLILMDVCTALHASGLDAAIKIKKLFPQIRIIIITSLPECSFIERAREGGVDSFWYKDPFENKLLDIMKEGFFESMIRFLFLQHPVIFFKNCVANFFAGLCSEGVSDIAEIAIS